MDTNSDITSMAAKRNGSNVWPYVIVGSAIGGAVGYLLLTDSGRKVRRYVTHPDELADDLEGARHFVEQKARRVTDQVHGILNKAKYGIEEGQAAYREAEQSFRVKARQIENKNTEIVSNVHKVVDNVNRTAVTIERSVLDPICEIGALYRGIERGIRTFFGKEPAQSPHEKFQGPTPTPIYQDTRVMG